MTKHLRHLSALLLWSCVGTASAAPAAYEISSKRSEIYAFAGPDRLAPFWMFTDRHVVLAKWIAGSVEIDPNDPGSCRVEVRVPSKELAIDPPELRAELGWEEVQPENRASVRHAIEGESMLWVEKYPAIKFRSQSCRWLEDGRMGLQGILSLRGVEKPLEVPLVISFERETFEATGTFEIQHEDFGMEPYADALGTIKIGRTITFVVRVVGIRAPDDEPQV